MCMVATTSCHLEATGKSGSVGRRLQLRQRQNGILRDGSGVS